MQIQPDDYTLTTEELEIALRYAASDTADAVVRAALLIAAATLANLKEASGE